MEKITAQQLLDRDGRKRWLAAVVAGDSETIDGHNLSRTFTLEERFRALELLDSLDNDY